MTSPRITWVGVAAAIVALGSSPLGALPAAGDTAGCVTKAEYGKANHGMTKRHVHRVFDTAGRQTFKGTTPLGTQYESRQYRTCTNPKSGFVHIDYKNQGLIEKGAYWG